MKELLAAKYARLTVSQDAQSEAERILVEKVNAAFEAAYVAGFVRGKALCVDFAIRFLDIPPEQLAKMKRIGEK